MLKQVFGCKLFTWEVIQGSTGKAVGDGDRGGEHASSGCVNEQVTNRGNWASVPLAGLCWNGSD